jgi:undecaprenyl-diphosphatase
LLGDLWQPLVGRLRPDEGALGFPSGHATSIATFGVSAIHLLGGSSLPRAPRRVVQGLVALLILAVGLARIFAGAHWPVDVLGGFALGASVAAGSAWWDATHPEASRVGAATSHDGPIPAR